MFDHVSLVGKLFKLQRTKQQEKVQLIYKPTSRNNLPNIAHLSRHSTGLNKLEVDSDCFENYQKL